MYILYLFFFLCVKINGQDICPNECYGDITNKTNSLSQRVHMPDFSVDLLFKNIRILIEKYNNLTPLLNILEKIKEKLNDGILLNSISKSISKIKNVIELINNAMEKLRLLMDNIFKYKSKCSETNIIYLKIQKEVEELKQAKQDIDELFWKIRSSEENIPSIIKESYDIQKNTSIILKRYSMGKDLFCKYFIDKINNTIELINTNKDILKKKFNEMFQINIEDMNNFIFSNRKLLIEYKKLSTTEFTLEDSVSLISDADKLISELKKLKLKLDNIRSMEMDYLKQREEEENNKINSFYGFLKTILERKKDVEEELKNLKFRELLKQDTIKLKTQYNSINNINEALKNITCPIYNDPEPEAITNLTQTL